MNDTLAESRAGEEKTKIRQMKKTLRKETLKIRDCIPQPDKARHDRRIRDILTGMPQYKEADVVLAYASYKSEVDTAQLIEEALAAGKYVFVPKVAGDRMEFWQITSFHSLHAGYRGIPEPDESVSFPEWMHAFRTAVDREDRQSLRAMMWMPGAVFDKDRHRIGYGGGFYDKYLECLEARLCFSMSLTALAYDCQIVARIPYEPHDIRPDMIITEKGIV